MYKLFSTLFLISIGLIGQSQTDLNRYAFKDYQKVKVIENGDSLINAWSGGMNFTQFNTFDLNNDNLEDLLIFDRTGNRLMPFLVELNNGNKRYKFAPEYVDSFPTIKNWMLLVDYDCDGRKDLFCAVSGGIGVYQNKGGLNFQWALPGRNLSTDYGQSSIQNLYTSALDLPGIVDVDGDGDIDIFTFGQGNTVQHHEGQVNCGLDFKLKFWCWGGFEEDNFTNKVNLDACNGFSPPPPNGNLTETTNKTQHSGSTILLIDLTGNDLYDAIIGDISYSNAISVLNDGTPDSAHMYAQDTTYPFNNTPIDLTYYPGFYYEDVNFDGHKDLIVTPSAEGSENHKNTWIYNNSNTTADPTFSLTDSSFIQEQMLEFGEGARPVLVDYNYDQLVDLFICNRGYFNKQGGGYTSRVAQYKNIGTINEPKFELVTKDFANLSSFNIGEDFHITFSDLDGDFDLDMFVGNLDGNIHYFENTGLIPNNNYVLTKPLFQGIDVGANATPFLYDVNNDGLKDLVIGTQLGVLHYYSNDGGSNLSFTLESTDFGGINTTSIYSTSGYSVPFLFREKEKTVLMVGTFERGILQFDSIDNVLNKPSSIEKTFGTGTVASSNSLVTPFGTSKKAGRNQFLYTASELLAQGLEYGKIKQLAIEVSGGSNPIIGYDGLKINMKLVNEDSLITFQENTILTFDKIIAVSQGWLNLDLDFPFLWDGESNLLIEFCFSKQASNTKDIAVLCTDVGFSANAFADGTGSGNQTKGCELNFAGNTNLRPNLKILLQQTFTLVSSTVQDGIKNAPAMANLDNDSLPELIVGNYSGGLRYYKGDTYTFPNISIAENRLLSNFVIFPNPAKEQITLKFDDLENEDFSVNIYDLHGRVLIHSSLKNGQTISTSKLNSGMYIVQVISEGSVVASSKLIILND